MQQPLASSVWIGLVVSIAIQPWTSQWMDVVSIYICPLGAALAGVMFFWVLGKEKGTLLLLTKALRSRSAAGSSCSASGYTLSVQFLH